jgi:hypothetical protein
MTIGDSARVDRRQLMGLGALAAAGLASRADGKETGIVEMSASDLATAIRARQVSCVEVAEAFLAQIDRLNPRYNAIVSLRDRSEVLKDAAERDASLARGETVGPLHGLPHAVKDLAPLAPVQESDRGGRQPADRPYQGGRRGLPGQDQRARVRPRLAHREPPLRRNA